MARLVLLILAILCYKQCKQCKDDDFDGFAFTGGRRPKQPQTVLRAVLDRSDAMKTLGLREALSFSEEELKRAYRQAVRTAHPDAPGGSARKLQRVKEAYDYLASSPTKVWDEGRRQYDAPASGFPQPTPSSGKPKPKPNAMRREIIVGGIVGATLLSIAIASQVVSTERRDAYLAQYGEAGELGEDMQGLDGTGEGKRLPPVVANGRFVRGQEYIRTAEVAFASRCQVLLLGDFLPGGEEMLGMGSLQRAKALTKLLSAALAASSSGDRLYKSITAVISQNDLSLVAQNLRALEDEGEDIREPRSPYLLFGGGAVLRFQKDDPEQELLLVPCQRLLVRSSDYDPLGPKTLAEIHKPNLVIFDLTKSQWEDLQEQFVRAVGGTYRPPTVLDSPEILGALQAALEKA